MTGPEDGFLRLLETLDRLAIPYMISGSAASSVHGLARATADIDLVVQLGEKDIEQLVASLKTEFYADEDQARTALELGRSFNVIHFRSSFKFDLFPLQPEPFNRSQFSRRQAAEHALFDGSGLRFPVASPEDVILSKLDWYRRGGEVSERQWNDVLGVLAVQRERLDSGYLRRWAGVLGVTELLEKALAERHEPLR
ncbi:MAG: hypothetical protein ACRD44_00585 [Bryobacteraceae bacterium]